jgi:organic radical activating enzyme
MIIPINERFISIQGEGRHTGRLSYFIRVQGCNLKCAWCDTKYTWKMKDYTNVLIDDLAHDAWQVVHDGKVHGIVITGGEPLLYIKAIKEVARRIIVATQTSSIDFIEVETNGLYLDVYEGWSDYPLDLILWNISPKLASSSAPLSVEYMGNKQMERILSKLNCIFKFVVKAGSAESIQEVIDFIDMHEIPKEKIWIMPQSLKREDQLGGITELADWVISKGFNFSLRMQNIIWDGRRGV